MRVNQQNTTRPRSSPLTIIALLIFLLCSQCLGFRQQCIRLTERNGLCSDGRGIGVRSVCVSDSSVRRPSTLYVALDNIATTTKNRDPPSPNSAFANIDLPFLSPRDKMKLAAGERVQRQDRDGRMGQGLVIIDVPADPDVIFDTLTQFSSYADIIPTVKASNVLVSDGVNAVAEFTLSRLKLRVNVLHRVYRDQRIVTFNLDRDRPNPVFKEANGYWHVQVPTDRPQGWSRVYLNASIFVNLLVPPFIMDYAASRALPRASKWIKPYFAKATTIIED